MLLAIILASFLGSIHCAGMCGGFVALYSTKAKQPAWHHVSYNCGRLLTYLTLGLVAGLLGASLHRSAAVIGAQFLASTLLGGTLILSGVQTLSNGRIFRRFPDPFKPSRLLGPLAVFLRCQAKVAGPRKRSFLLGATSTLLPCGWLYSFLVIAAAAGSLLSALSVMFVFWLGTLPALLLTGLLSRSAGFSLARFAPKATAVLIIGIGLVSLIRHDLSLIPDFSPMSCHEIR